MGYPASGVVLAGVLGLLTLACGGLGGLVMAWADGCQIGGRPRQLVTESLLGLLAFTVFFGVLAELGAPAWLAGAYVAAFVLLGGGALIVRRDALAWRLAGALGASVVALLCALTPVNLAAVDPWNYAYITATLFQRGWAEASLGGLTEGGALVDLTQLGMLTRADALGLLWPVAALRFPVDARLVAALGAWLLVGAMALAIDVLKGHAPLPARLVLAAGGIGAFNLTSLLTGGQVNQAYALATCAALVWLWRYVESARVRRAIVALGSAAIAGSYPEFLAALPLYLVCLGLVRPEPLARAAWLIPCFTAGVLAVAVTTRLGLFDYLLTQAQIAPLWWPLASDPTNPLEQWQAILVQRLPPRASLILVLPAAWYAWRLAPPQAERAGYRVAVALGCAVALIAVWSWLLTHAGNVNYATFKVAGWLSPGLVLFGWLLRPYLASRVARTAAAGVLALATLHVLGMAAELYSVGPLYSGPPDARPGWQVERVASECTVLVDTPQQRALAEAVAATAAAANDCAVATPSVAQ